MFVQKLVDRAKPRPLVLAHRGVSRHYPENTMRAFQAALDSGADGIEFDVFQLADGAVVVFHDEDTERLTGERHALTQLTWDQVSRLRVGGERIPLLAEVLDAFAGKLVMEIEMKAYQPRWERRATGAATARLAGAYAADAFVTSFDPFMLHALEAENAALVSGFAYDDAMQIHPSEWANLNHLPFGGPFVGFLDRLGNNFVQLLAESNLIGGLLRSSVVGVEYSLLDADTIAKFHAREIAVGTYTFFSTDPSVPDRLTPAQQHARIRELQAQGVDWIETDDPEQVLTMLATEPRA